jgi:hypothetical protein
MKFKINITSFKTIDEVPEYWSTEDYITLLDLFGFPDAESAEESSLKELLQMAITDYEPNEAAAIVLEYKLNGDLSKGQIEQISNDMLLDKIAEEYPEISLHATLFHVNTKASHFECTITPLEKNGNVELTKEVVLKLLDGGLSDSNLIKRLFGDKMTGNTPFPEADSILWNLESKDSTNFKILTSEYWLSQDDLIADEFEGEYEESEEEEED